MPAETAASAETQRTVPSHAEITEHLDYSEIHKAGEYAAMLVDTALKFSNEVDGVEDIWDFREIPPDLAENGLPPIETPGKVEVYRKHIEGTKDEYKLIIRMANDTENPDESTVVAASVHIDPRNGTVDFRKPFRINALTEEQFGETVKGDKGARKPRRLQGAGIYKDPKRSGVAWLEARMARGELTINEYDGNYKKAHGNETLQQSHRKRIKKVIENERDLATKHFARHERYMTEHSEQLMEAWRQAKEQQEREEENIVVETNAQLDQLTQELQETRQALAQLTEVIREHFGNEAADLLDQIQVGDTETAPAAEEEEEIDTIADTSPAAEPEEEEEEHEEETAEFDMSSAHRHLLQIAGNPNALSEGREYIEGLEGLTVAQRNKLHAELSTYIVRARHLQRLAGNPNALSEGRAYINNLEDASDAEKDQLHAELSTYIIRARREKEEK